MVRRSKKNPQEPPRDQESNSTAITIDEQGELLETAPPNSKEILRAAKRYKSAQLARITALQDEVEEKAKLLKLIKEANVQRLEDGTMRFHVQGMLITVTPREELVKVKDENETEAETD